MFRINNGDELKISILLKSDFIGYKENWHGGYNVYRLTGDFDGPVSIRRTRESQPLATKV